MRNNPSNRTDPNGRCSPPPGLKPGQVGICIEAFIAAKTFRRVGSGNDRTFNGNDEKLTSKFRVDIIAERTPGNSKNLNVTQKTTAGFSNLVEPLTGIQSPGVQGTANSKLNSIQGNSNSPSVSAHDPDGSTSITVPIDRSGNASFNLTTKADNAFADFKSIVDLGTIRSSFNLSLNANNGIAKLEDGSQKTGYPSFAIYSYTYEGKNIVTREVYKKDEGSPDDLKEPGLTTFHSRGL